MEALYSAEAGFVADSGRLASDTRASDDVSLKPVTVADAGCSPEDAGPGRGDRRAAALLSWCRNRAGRESGRN